MEKTKHLGLNKPKKTEFYGIDIANENADIIDKEIANKSDKSTVVDTILPAADWIGVEVPYSIKVEVEGVTTDTKVEGMEHPDCTKEEFEAYGNAKIRTGVTGVGTVTLKCFGKVPAINLPVRFIVRGD